MINFGRKKQVQRKENLIVDVQGMFQIKEKENRIFFVLTWNELLESFFLQNETEWRQVENFERPFFTQSSGIELNKMVGSRQVESTEYYSWQNVSENQCIQLQDYVPGFNSHQERLFSYLSEILPK